MWQSIEIVLQKVIKLQMLRWRLVSRTHGQTSTREETLTYKLILPGKRSNLLPIEGNLSHLCRIPAICSSRRNLRLSHRHLCFPAGNCKSGKISSSCIQIVRACACVCACARVCMCMCACVRAHVCDIDSWKCRLELF